MVDTSRSIRGDWPPAPPNSRVVIDTNDDRLTIRWDAPGWLGPHGVILLLGVLTLGGGAAACFFVPGSPPLYRFLGVFLLILLVMLSRGMLRGMFTWTQVLLDKQHLTISHGWRRGQQSHRLDVHAVTRITPTHDFDCSTHKPPPDLEVCTADNQTTRIRLLLGGREVVWLADVLNNVLAIDGPVCPASSPKEVEITEATALPTDVRFEELVDGVRWILPVRVRLRRVTGQSRRHAGTVKRNWIHIILLVWVALLAAWIAGDTGQLPVPVSIMRAMSMILVVGAGLALPIVCVAALFCLGGKRARLTVTLHRGLLTVCEKRGPFRSSKTRPLDELRRIEILRKPPERAGTASEHMALIRARFTRGPALILGHGYDLGLLSGLAHAIGQHAPGANRLHNPTARIEPPTMKMLCADADQEPPGLSAMDIHDSDNSLTIELSGADAEASVRTLVWPIAWIVGPLVGAAGAAMIAWIVAPAGELTVHLAVATAFAAFCLVYAVLAVIIRISRLWAWSQLIVDRGHFVARRSFPPGSRSWPLDQIDDIRVDESSDEDKQRHFRLTLLTADGKAKALLTKRHGDELNWICRRLNEACTRFGAAASEEVTSRARGEPVDVVLSGWPDPPKPGSISVVSTSPSLKIRLKRPTVFSVCLFGFASGLVILVGVGAMVLGGEFFDRGETFSGTMLQIAGGLVGLAGFVSVVLVAVANVIEETVEVGPDGLLRIGSTQRRETAQWRVDRVAAVGVGRADGYDLISRVAHGRRPRLRIGKLYGLQVTTTDGKTRTALETWDEPDLEWIAALLRRRIGVDTDPSS